MNIGSKYLEVHRSIEKMSSVSLYPHPQITHVGKRIVYWPANKTGTLFLISLLMPPK